MVSECVVEIASVRFMIDVVLSVSVLAAFELEIPNVWRFGG